MEYFALVTSIVLAELAWWGPIAIVGGAVGGLALSYALLVFIGAPPPSRRSRRLRFERTERTNYPVLNPAAFMVALGMVGLVVGLAVGLSAG